MPWATKPPTRTIIGSRTGDNASIVRYPHMRTNLPDKVGVVQAGQRPEQKLAVVRPILHRVLVLGDLHATSTRGQGSVSRSHQELAEKSKKRFLELRVSFFHTAHLALDVAKILLEVGPHEVDAARVAPVVVDGYSVLLLPGGEEEGWGSDHRGYPLPEWLFRLDPFPCALSTI